MGNRRRQLVFSVGLALGLSISAALQMAKARADEPLPLVIRLMGVERVAPPPAAGAVICRGLSEH